MWSLFPKLRSALSRANAVRQITSLPAVVASALTSVSATAVEYIVTPSVVQRVTFDNNLQLSRDDLATEAYMYRITPGVELRATGDSWRVSGEGSIGFERFDEEQFNSDNQRGRLGVQWFSEKQVFGLDASITREAQRTAEIEGTGILGFEATRVENINVRPSFQRQLSERLRLTVGATFNNRHFAFTDLNDYETLGLDLALTRQLTETSAIDFTLFGQEFETESRPVEACQFGIWVIPNGLTFGDNCTFAEQGRESTTYGAQIGWRNSFTSRLDFNVSAGVREVESRDVTSSLMTNCIFSPSGVLLLACTNQDDQEVSDTSSGLLARSGVTYRGERSQYEFSVERSVSPLGLGFLVETDRANLTYRYSFSRRMRGAASATYLDTESATAGVEFDRKFAVVDLRLDWAVAQNWRLQPGVRFRQQESDAFGLEADSVTAFVNLNYNPQPSQFAR